MYIQISIRLPQRKNVTNGETIGGFLFHSAQIIKQPMANPPCAIPTVMGRCRKRPKANTSKGSVPKFEAMKHAAPKEKRRHPIK